MKMLLPTTSKKFDAYAEEASRLFLEKYEPLNDVIVKIASRENLNPEEVKRLVEKANTLTTVKMLQSSLDKKAEIDLADYDIILKKTHPVGDSIPGSMSKAAGDIPYHLPDIRTMKKAASVDFGKFVKEGCKDMPAMLSGKKDEGIKKDKAGKSLVTRMHELDKKAMDLYMQKLAAENSIHDGLTFLVNTFMKCSPQTNDFNKFASEICALYGEGAMPVLDSMAAYICKPLVLAKIAADFVIDDTGEEFSRFTQVMKDFQKLAEIKNSLTAALTELTEIKNTMEKSI